MAEGGKTQGAINCTGNSFIGTPPKPVIPEIWEGVRKKEVKVIGLEANEFELEVWIGSSHEQCNYPA